MTSARGKQTSVWLGWFCCIQLGFDFIGCCLHFQSCLQDVVNILVVPRSYFMLIEKRVCSGEGLHWSDVVCYAVELNRTKLWANKHKTKLCITSISIQMLLTKCRITIMSSRRTGEYRFFIFIFLVNWVNLTKEYRIKENLFCLLILTVNHNLLPNFNYYYSHYYYSLNYI